MKQGALFYPKEDKFGKKIPFDSLFIPYVYKEIYLEVVYTDVFNEQPKESMVILDVGANIGIVTQYMKKWAKKLYAIEPASEHFAALKKNKEFNKWDNVEVFNIAIGAEDGEAELRLCEPNRTSHSIALAKTSNKRGEKVKTQTFATFFKENKIEKVDFCKFDVEGAEEQILFSNGFVSVADKIQAMEIEFHFKTFPRTVEHLLRLGFKSKRYSSSAVVILFYR